MNGYCDAHNHLQDERFGGRHSELLAAAAAVGIDRWVVNGACESDWGDVARLAGAHPGIVPSFGYHPWYLPERTPHWREALVQRLDATPRAVVGEIGLDRWLPGLPAGQRRARFPALPPGEPASWDEQVEAFRWQMDLATRRGLPVTIHCLQAWGPLLELLRVGPVPAPGFLLHSYGGSAEMIPELARLGACFGFPGYFLADRKRAQRDVFRAVPSDRLLVETDAPDQLLPEALTTHPLADAATGVPINHPANLAAVYAGLAAHLGRPLPALRDQVARNFERLFGPVPPGHPAA